MSMQQDNIPAADLARFSSALPFWLSLGLVPFVWVGALYGGWAIPLMPLMSWFLFAILDFVLGENSQNADTDATEQDMFWYRMLTMIWVPTQVVTVFSLIWYVPQAEHLDLAERMGVFFGVGVISGAIGINYSHELMHQKSKIERWLADILLALVLYSHFRSEHLLVHHRYVATPRDPVTARYNEGFHRYYPRVLRQCLQSAFKAEADMLARKGLRWTNLRNPFFKYWALQLGFLSLAFVLGGWSGVLLFLLQAGVAIWQLELVNYIEHYGLTRKHLGDGKYEHVQPHHSWNTSYRASNWLLINLQRHSDHHYKPDRRFPVLQNYGPEEAPQMPYGYPTMTIAAMIPPLWHRIMKPRVREWRKRHYPEIKDWSDYNKHRTPMPR